MSSVSAVPLFSRVIFLVLSLIKRSLFLFYSIVECSVGTNSHLFRFYLFLFETERILPMGVSNRDLGLLRLSGKVCHIKSIIVLSEKRRLGMVVRKKLVRTRKSHQKGVQKMECGTNQRTTETEPFVTTILKLSEQIGLKTSRLVLEQR